MHFINAFVHQKSKYTVIYQQWFLPLRKLIKFYSDSLLHLCLWKFVSISEMGKWKLTKAMWFSQSHMVSRQRNHNLNLGALALKQSSLMRFAATWMDLEDLMLSKICLSGEFLAVRRLRLDAFIARAPVQSLVRELRSCKPSGGTKNKKPDR